MPGWLLNLDIHTFYLINNGMHNSLMDWLMPLITRLGNGGTVWLVAGLMLWFFRRREGGGKDCLLLIMVLVSSYLICDLLFKDVIQRARPFVTLTDVRLLIAPEESFSFPSGHATTSFACAFFLARRWTRAALLFIAIAVSIAFSRIYVGVHYPLDVMGGCVLGCLCAYFPVVLESGLRGMQSKYHSHQKTPSGGLD